MEFDWQDPFNNVAVSEATAAAFGGTHIFVMR
jgi:hypothetical protein